MYLLHWTSALVCAGQAVQECYRARRIHSSYWLLEWRFLLIHPSLGRDELQTL